MASTNSSSDAVAPSQQPPTAILLDWPTDPHQYKLMGKIGHGAFASVWKARTIRRGQLQQQQPQQQKQQGQYQEPAATTRTETTPSFVTASYECVVAVKILNLDHVNSNLDEIRCEVQAMRLSSHPNVLACHAAFINDTLLWVVTPLMRKGSSIHCLETARRRIRQQFEEKTADAATRSLSEVIAMEDHIFYILYETLLGLQYIHGNGQIHRDIKASNILLDGTGEVKIADFGVCSFLIHSGWSQQTKAKTFVGTPCWMAPEVMEQVHGYDYTADIWSLGITALELAMGYAPYAKFPPMKVLVLTLQEEPPSLETYNQLEAAAGTADDDDDGVVDCRQSDVIQVFSTSFREFVHACLQKKPAQRPLCQDLLKSKHFAAFADPSSQNYRMERRSAIEQQVCSLVDDVGSETSSWTNSATTLPRNGGSPTSSDKDHSVPQSSQEQQQQQQYQQLEQVVDRPAGTTWIFPDEHESQSVGSSQQQQHPYSTHDLDDVLEKLDQFGLETGGENYYKTSGTELNDEADEARAQEHEQQQQQQEQQEQQKLENDEIDQFFDEFEKSTVGEHFRRQP